ncbi:MAG: diguanylate cyclase [Pseudomonadota bacterium]
MNNPMPAILTTEYVMEQQVTLLRSVAQRMLEGPQRLLEQQEALLSVIKSPVFQSDHLEPAFELLTETTARLMNVSRVGVWRYNEARSAIHCVDLLELSSGRHSSGVTLQASQFPRYFEALSASEAICADDARTDLRTSEFRDSYLDPLGIKSMMDIPLILGGRLEGVICHEQVGTVKSWMPEDRLFGMAIANLAVLALERCGRNHAARELQVAEERRRSEIEERLRESEERYRNLVDNLKIVVFQTDVVGLCTFLNPAWTDLTGFSVDHGLTRCLQDNAHADDASVCEHLIHTVFEDQRDCRVEMRVVTASGEVRWVEAYARPIKSSQGKVIASSGTLTDITERKASDARIERLAYYDALTGLPNRTLLLDRLDRALAEARRHTKHSAVLFVDLDDFKTINDTLGHITGDAMLAQIGERLKNLLREQDTIGRFGGDEFLVILSRLETREDARAVCMKTIDAIAQPFRIGEHELSISASIGVSVYPEDGGDRDALLKHADAALYRAKKMGRRTFQFHEAG